MQRNIIFSLALVLLLLIFFSSCSTQHPSSVNTPSKNHSSANQSVSNRNHDGDSSQIPGSESQRAVAQGEEADKPGLPADEEIFDAIIAGNISTISDLLEKHPEAIKATGDSDRTPLFAACDLLYDHKHSTPADLYGLIELLLDEGADVNATNIHGVTPLYSVCSKIMHISDNDPSPFGSYKPLTGEETASKLALGKSISQLLIDRGAQVNLVANEDDMTPLEMVVYCGNYDMAELLLANEAYVYGMAKPSEADIRCTPLYLAVSNGQDNMVQLLINNGADINAGDKDGRTIMSWFKEGDNKKALQLLEKYGAKE